jgi:hypothetical protein
MYLKNNEELKSSRTELCAGVYRFGGEQLSSPDTCPFVDIVEDFDLLKSNKVLQPLFLKATKIGAVRYCTSREHGLYVYGKAKASLTSREKDYYYIEVETSSWEGIADMETLQEKIQAGTILPIISYEKKQVKNHLLEVLGQILDSRNLNKIQRFFLAWRLSIKK